MKLRELMSGLAYEIVKGDLEQEITGVIYDSRKVVPGSLFVCIKGFVSDGGGRNGNYCRGYRSM